MSQHGQGYHECGGRTVRPAHGYERYIRTRGRFPTDRGIGSLCLQVLGQKSGLAMFSLNIIAQFFVGQGLVLSSGPPSKTTTSSSSRASLPWSWQEPRNASKSTNTLQLHRCLIACRLRLLARRCPARQPLAEAGQQVHADASQRRLVRHHDRRPPRPSRSAPSSASAPSPNTRPSSSRSRSSSSSSATSSARDRGTSAASPSPLAPSPSRGSRSSSPCSASPPRKARTSTTST